jgi:uncharacterized protein (TIGR03437 family)
VKRSKSILAGLALVMMSHAAAQNISGVYQVVYGVWQRGTAFTIIGTATFDGAGKYTFQGTQRSVGHSASVSGGGSYALQADLTGSLSNPLDSLLPALNLRISSDGATLGASTIDYNTTYQHDLWIAVRAPSGGKSVTDLAGSWGGVANFYNPSPVLARAGRFLFQFDGKGSITAQDWNWHESDQNNGALQQASATGAYTLGADGTGTYTSPFGTKRIAISADGLSFIGTDDASGQELIYAVKAGAPPSGLQGRYHWLQMVAVAPGGNATRGSAFAWTITNDLGSIDTNGTQRGAGSNQFLDGPTGRLIDMSAMLGPFTTASNGYVDLTFGGLQSAGIGAMRSDAGALPWTNITSTVTGTYSLNILLKAARATLPAQGPWLDPGGARHEAGFSTDPAPFAGGTLMSVSGIGLAASAESAHGIPLPFTLGGTSLTVSGQPAALTSVAPDRITFILPFAVNGAGKVDIQATAGGTATNTIPIHIAPAMPAFFSQAGNGLGPVLAFHEDGNAITSTSPARPGETITIYATGLGAVVAAPDEGQTATQASAASIPVQVDFALVLGNVLYAGLAPGFPGVYQINVVVPQVAATAAANMRILQGYTQSHPKVTIAIGN